MRNEANLYNGQFLPTLMNSVFMFCWDQACLFFFIKGEEIWLDTLAI